VNFKTAVFTITKVTVGCTQHLPSSATGKMRMCGRADLRILERDRVKIMDLD